MPGIWNPHTLLMGINEATIILWKTVRQFLKRLNRWPNPSTPRYIPNRTEHTTHMSTNVDSGIIPKSHKGKTPQVYVSWWTDKQNALQPHSKVQCGWASKTSCQVEEARHRRPCVVWVCETTRTGEVLDKSRRRGSGGDNGERPFSRYSAAYGGKENAPELDSGDGCATPGTH